MWNFTEIIYDFLELYGNLIIENILQNFNDRYFNQSCVTNNQCDYFKREKIWPRKVKRVGFEFIETFRVGSGDHLSH